MRLEMKLSNTLMYYAMGAERAIDLSPRDLRCHMEARLTMQGVSKQEGYDLDKWITEIWFSLPTEIVGE